MLYPNYSALVTSFNNEYTIERALNSITNQTVKPSEIICVDDASSDRTVEVVERFCLDMKTKIKIIRRRQNEGAAITRNDGILACTTDYVAFLDGDDTWLENKMEIQLPYLKKGFCFVGGPSKFKGSPKTPILKKISNASSISKILFLTKNLTNTSSVVLARNPRRFFDPSFKRCEDYELWLQFWLSSDKAIILFNPLSEVHKKFLGEAGLSADRRLMYFWEEKVVIHILNQVPLGFFSRKTLDFARAAKRKFRRHG